MNDVIISVEQDKPDSTVEPHIIPVHDDGNREKDDEIEPHNQEKNDGTKPHNGNSITRLEVSPNDKYLVTYSDEDNSIVGWNIEDIYEGPLKPDITVKINNRYKLNKICVSDHKKLACIYIYEGRNFLSK